MSGVLGELGSELSESNGEELPVVLESSSSSSSFSKFRFTRRDSVDGGLCGRDRVSRVYSSVSSRYAGYGLDSVRWERCGRQLRGRGTAEEVRGIGEKERIVEASSRERLVEDEVKDENSDGSDRQCVMSVVSDSTGSSVEDSSP